MTVIWKAIFSIEAWATRSATVDRERIAPGGGSVIDAEKFSKYVLTHVVI